MCLYSVVKSLLDVITLKKILMMFIKKTKKQQHNDIVNELVISKLSFTF